MEKFLINAGLRETRVAGLHDDFLEEYWVEQEVNRGLTGNVYLGRVTRVLPGMQSAFVDIGLERTAYLHVSMVRQPKGEKKRLPIEEVIHQGQTLIVQVIKDPVGTKGARLSMLISLPGRNLVYLPYEDHIGVSQRIADPAQRDALRATIAALRPEDDKGGYIVRTCGTVVREADFCFDMQYLRRRWADILAAPTKRRAPALLYTEPTLEERLLRDRVSEATEAVIVDSLVGFERLTGFAKKYMPDVLDRIVRYEGKESLFAHYDIAKRVDKALERRVGLPSGGYLVIDQTEAMTTVDVNTGAFVGRHDFQDTVLKTNVEAARAIARQMRLRNLGGIVIVDFIDMEAEDGRRKVLAALRDAVALDRNVVTVSDFTELGLVELTRKRTRDSLSSVLCEPCPLCEGRGMILTARSVVYALLRELGERCKTHPEVTSFDVTVAPSVADLLDKHERKAVDLFMSLTGKRLTWKPDASIAQDHYDIVMK